MSQNIYISNKLFFWAFYSLKNPEKNYLSFHKNADVFNIDNNNNIDNVSLSPNQHIRMISEETGVRLTGIIYMFKNIKKIEIIFHSITVLLYFD